VVQHPQLLRGTGGCAEGGGQCLNLRKQQSMHIFVLHLHEGFFYHTHPWGFGLSNEMRCSLVSAERHWSLQRDSSKQEKPRRLLELNCLEQSENGLQVFSLSPNEQQEETSSFLDVRKLEWVREFDCLGRRMVESSRKFDAYEHERSLRENCRI